MLEGEISEIQLVKRLVELWREQFTGAIRFENEGIIKIIYFKGGDILSASTNDRSDSIDEILMRAGKVSREHVKQALAKRKESETLGDALLNLGFITRKELTWARRVQVVGVIRSIAAWATGSFTIVADYLPKRDEGTLFPVPQVIVELIVTDQDRATFERALDGGSAVFEKSPDFDEVFRRLGLNEDAEAITSEIDGVQSASEVANASRRDAFNAYKLIHALATLGILNRVQEVRAQPDFVLDDFSSAGVADAADMLDEPVVPQTPRFEFDEEEAARQPTLEVPSLQFDDEPVGPASSAAPAAASAWDEPDELAASSQPLPERMPAWSAPPEPVPSPIPAVAKAAAGKSAAPAEEGWGFDDAQIETAKKATKTVNRPRTPVKPPKKSEQRYGLLLAVLGVILLAAAGYYGWRWYQGRQEQQIATASPVKPPEPQRKVPPVLPVTTTQPVETTVTLVEPTSTVPPTTTVPPRAPMQVTAPAPVPQSAAAQAMPPVVPKQGPRRYEAMAREFAENPTGNFTVQIQILCETSNLDKAILTGGSFIWFVPQTIGSRTCYRVFWGHYATREEAQKALATVPATLRDRTSAVKPVPRGQ